MIGHRQRAKNPSTPTVKVGQFALLRLTEKGGLSVGRDGTVFFCQSAALDEQLVAVEAIHVRIERAGERLSRGVDGGSDDSVT
jgi:hypothetical protein